MNKTDDKRTGEYISNVLCDFEECFEGCPFLYEKTDHALCCRLDENWEKFSDDYIMIKKDTFKDMQKALASVSVRGVEMDEYISRAEAVKIASGYCHLSNVAKELAELPGVIMPSTPCDLCMFNFPSGSDGKPCSMCPAIGIVL